VGFLFGEGQEAAVEKKRISTARKGNQAGSRVKERKKDRGRDRRRVKGIRGSSWKGQDDRRKGRTDYAGVGRTFWEAPLLLGSIEGKKRKRWHILLHPKKGKGWR